MEEFKTGCLICGQELIYLPQREAQTCCYCGKSYESDARCVNGHYICDACHSLGADDLIEQFCVQATLSDPLELAVTLMKHPALKMHGPEHHFLVPAVLLAAYYNHAGKAGSAQEKAAKIKQARKRAENVKGGFCGFYGACGAAVGTGIFVSVMTGATPLSKTEWRLSNQATAENLAVIAEQGGPRCCKRNTTLALLTAGNFIRQHFDPAFPVSDEVPCQFYPMNKECLQQECPFYPSV